MRKLLILSCGILFLSLTLSAPSAHAQIWAPEHGPIQIGIGYQYSHYNVLGTTFHNHGLNTTFAYHVFDPLTGASRRITASLEGTVASGFEGHATGFSSNVEAKSLFVGGGPHLALESESRLEPWVHVLVGLDHLRFTQTSTLGTANAFGFMAGGGVDFRLNGPIAWRVQADYLGTRFSTWIQSNYSFGTGLVINF
ncbi:MAG TPA: hypothetical protein VNI36_07115 [Candidatus Dormibacteraeota bacterium]|nr:hypothetical protein [Candidatus Dormibacteraeota bacterium]